VHRVAKDDSVERKIVAPTAGAASATACGSAVLGFISSGCEIGTSGREAWDMRRA